MSTICMYYMRGSCRFGNRCWNSHDLNSRSSDIYLSGSSDDEESVARAESITSQTVSPSSSTSKAEQRQSQKSQKSQTESQSSPQPLWNLTNSSSGETKEGTSDSILIETVKKLNEADNMVKVLRQQLRSKNDDHFSWIEHQMEQCIDNDLQCNICYELFIKPTVLNCSHTFCHECIESWTRRVNHCPTCRVYVKSKAYCLGLDTFLDKITDCLSDDIKSRREALKLERNNTRTETNRVRRNNRRRNNRNQSVRRTIGMLWGENSREGGEWNISFQDALFDPINLGDVLSRERNDRNDRNNRDDGWDDWEDVLSDSSLDSNEYGSQLCSYCDNIGHSAFNCPISIMEEAYY